jgi:hypothetical protein
MARKKKRSPTRAKPAKKRRVAVKRAGVKSKPVKRKPAKPARGKKPVARSKAKTRKTKPVARKAVRKSGRKDVLGEGNYTASRNFREQETAFVQRNKSRIPKLGKEAETALEGPEGKDLLAAEAEARGHSHAPGAED